MALLSEAWRENPLTRAPCMPWPHAAPSLLPFLEISLLLRPPPPAPIRLQVHTAGEHGWCAVQVSHEWVVFRASMGGARAPARAAALRVCDMGLSAGGDCTAPHRQPERHGQQPPNGFVAQRMPGTLGLCPQAGTAQGPASPAHPPRGPPANRPAQHRLAHPPQLEAAAPGVDAGARVPAAWVPEVQTRGAALPPVQ